MKKVIVGMSGGVDSSVAAFLLKQQGYNVQGLFMKNWDEDDDTPYCTAKADLADAQQVCEKLGIQLHTANFAVEYWDNVFEIFLSEYASGRTPNPDVLCNREIKFKVFLEYAEILGADYIATGHYGRILKTDSKSQLLKAIDRDKDQSYFLYAVSADALSKSLFPLGHMTKSEVRRIARNQNFVTSAKKDSTGICFIGERRFRDFLSKFLPSQPGVIETLDGSSIGEHHGIMFYTIGQRQGLGIGGLKDSSHDPWYVIRKDIERNVLIVAQGAQHPLLFSNTLVASKLQWINTVPSCKEFYCSAKIRYRQPDQPCLVKLGDVDNCEVVFTENQRATTPGQSVVFYSDEHCLGGGIIDKACNRVD